MVEAAQEEGSGRGASLKQENKVQHQRGKNHNNKKESDDNFLWEGSSDRF